METVLEELWHGDSITSGFRMIAQSLGDEGPVEPGPYDEAYCNPEA